MLMKVRPIIQLREFEEKPGKNEKVTFLKLCSKNCPNCDTKRMTCCKNNS
jgi:hypothetical protein